jgi:Tfp pilus assembly protein PilF
MDISLFISRLHAGWWAALVVLLCVGCALPGRLPSTSGATTQGPQSIPSGPTSAPFFERPSAGAVALNEGVAAFNLGEYRLAETKLAESFSQGLTNTPDILRAYKTQAFVYCVTMRTAQCEKSFETALGVDKKFDLSPSERQHPVWGPVFAKIHKRYAS